jgi:hypothetical protein
MMIGAGVSKNQHASFSEPISDRHARPGPGVLVAGRAIAPAGGTKPEGSPLKDRASSESCSTRSPGWRGAEGLLPVDQGEGINETEVLFT